MNASVPTQDSWLLLAFRREELKSVSITLQSTVPVVWDRNNQHNN